MRIFFLNGIFGGRLGFGVGGGWKMREGEGGGERMLVGIGGEAGEGLALGRGSVEVALRLGRARIGESSFFWS